MKKKILHRDHDINKVTNRLKQIQQKEIDDARELSKAKNTSQNVKLIKSKIQDLKKDIRRKEELLEMEEQRIQNVIWLIRLRKRRSI
jgi:hypothetical protein